MMLQKYHKIVNINSHVLSKFRGVTNTHKCDWAVTEMVDGDHLAFYADKATNFFKASTRKRFLKDSDIYSVWKETVELHKEWIMAVSQKLDSPIIVYGKLIGGSYKGKSKGCKIKTVAQYCTHNDFVIHDIKVKGNFIAMHELENLARTYQLTIAPILWKGAFNKVQGFPENRLSAIPFLYELPVIWTNEMKGVVMRPIYAMHVGCNQLIMKKLNRDYIQQRTHVYVPVTLTELLMEVAEDMIEEAERLTLLTKVITANNGYSYNDIDKLTGKFVKLVLDKVIIVKYNALTNKERSLVHKELNKYAKVELASMLKSGSEAA